MIRRIARGLKRRFKKLAKKLGSKWEPVTPPEWGVVIPPRKFWVEPSDTMFQFFRWTIGWLNYLTLLGKLGRNSSVLEIGCHHGRTMLALLQYLEPPGRYEGLDILAEPVEFAQKNINSKFPNFNFRVADLYNSLYRPEGKQQAESYKFPYSDASFDVTYAASVFTHVTPPVCANYLKETRRVLRKGGRSVYSFFVLDHYQGPGTSERPFFEFNFPLADFAGAAVHDLKRPEHLIAYKMASIKKMASDAGLELVQVVPGTWSKTSDVGVSEQDLLVFEAI